MAKFCTKCGGPLKENAKFCPKCGAPVRVIPPVTQNIPESIPESMTENIPKVSDETVHVTPPTNTYRQESLYDSDPDDISTQIEPEQFTQQTQMPEQPPVINDPYSQPQEPDDGMLEPDVPDEYYNPEPVQKKSKSWLIGLLIGLVVVALIGGGIFAVIHFDLFGSDDEYPTAAVNEGSGTSEITEKDMQNLEKADSETTESTDTAEPAVSEVDDTPGPYEEEATDKDREPSKAAESSAEGNQPIGCVDVTTARIRLRSGPSTSSKDSGKRTAVGDHYEVYEKTTGEGYTWYRISESSVWIADNGSWMRFTEYTYEDPDYITPDVFAEKWYDIYLSYLKSMNNGGDFSYLIDTASSQVDVFRDNYHEHNEGYEFTNIAFDFDLDDYTLTNLGDGAYEVICHAIATNDVYSLSAKTTSKIEVKLLARLKYNKSAKTWQLVSQKNDSSYKSGKHNMLHCAES